MASRRHDENIYGWATYNSEIVKLIEESCHIVDRSTGHIRLHSHSLSRFHAIKSHVGRNIWVSAQLYRHALHFFTSNSFSKAYPLPLFSLFIWAQGPSRRCKHEAASLAYTYRAAHSATILICSGDIYDINEAWYTSRYFHLLAMKKFSAFTTPIGIYRFWLMLLSEPIPRYFKTSLLSYILLPQLLIT